jgi:ribosomal subunit interface protein
MLLPLQCTFRGMPHSDALEAHVTRRAGKLDRFFGRIMHCHVVIEVNQRHHRHGKRYRVSIDLTVPRRHEIAIARAPSPDRFLDDAHAAIERAFDEAERRLVDWEHRLRALRRRPGERSVEIVA